MIRIHVAALAVVVFLSACNNNAGNTSGTDTTQIEPVAQEANETTELQQSFPSLFTYLESQDSSFAATNFVETETSALRGHAAFPIQEEIQAFAPYFIYNSDSSLAIDLYSNNYIIRQRGGKQVLQRGGPDTEISLLNVKNKTEQRLLFTGPSVSILDAKWISANEIFVAGAEELDNNQVRPMLWKINLPDSTIQLYSYPDTLQAMTHIYAEEKLKQGGL